MLILLTIHAIPGRTYKSIPKISLISQCKMKSQEEPLSDTDTSTDLELIALDNLQYSQPCASTSTSTASTSTAPPSTAQLQTYSSKQDYKSPDVQRVQCRHYII